MSRRGLIFLTIAATVAAVCAGFAVYMQNQRVVAGFTRSPNSAKTTVDLDDLRKRASAGDVESQVKLGTLNLEATDHPANYTEAFKWLEQAAQSNNAQAEFLLGSLYQSGRGVQRDYTNARVWFEKAAAQKHAEALYNLGSLYGAGRGVPEDSQKAAQYYGQAAELGDSYAQFNMAQRCELGRGVATNLVEAWKWYDLAGLGGVADAPKRKNALQSRMSGSELQQARQSVDAFLKQNGSGKTP